MEIVSLTASDVNIKLRPCPFCGSSDVLLQNTWTPSYWVECQDCEATARGECSSFSTNAEAFDKERHRQAAISSANAWNGRISNEEPAEHCEEDQPGWCGHCACQSCYEAQKRNDC
jgi:hypothetical protein